MGRHFQLSVCLLQPSGRYWLYDVSLTKGEDSKFFEVSLFQVVA